MSLLCQHHTQIPARRDVRCCAQQQQQPIQRRHSQGQAAEDLSLITRRSVLGLALVPVALTLPQQPALAGERGLGRYIRKKRLDPLETYVPLVLVAREQLLEAGTVMMDQPSAARDLLRKGAFDGLRENIRVMGEYAAINDKSAQPAPLVNNFFRGLEDFDLLLAVNVREGKPLIAEEAQAALDAAVKGLDALISTVPQDILDRSRRVLEVTREKERAAEEELAAMAAAETPAAAAAPAAETPALSSGGGDQPAAAEAAQTPTTPGSPASSEATVPETGTTPDASAPADVITGPNEV